MPGQDMTWYSGNKHLEDESLKSKFRDFKLTLLQSNFEFKVNTENFQNFKQSHAYKVMTTYYPNELLSGSISLYLHGLLDFREFNDIDIIVDDRQKVSDYTPMNNSNVDNFIGHKYISIEPEYKFFKRLFGALEAKKIKVDFFENKNCECTIIDGLKIHNPMEIIHFKLNLAYIVGTDGYSNTNKHISDLEKIFNSF
jgi:hypothetical protein